MQKHTKLETGDHAGGGRRRTSASPAPPVMQRISHVHLIRRGVAAAPPSPHRQRRCTISSEAGLAPLGLPRGCAHPTSTSSVAATSVMCCASDARLSGAALRKTETKNSAPHRTDAGRSFVTAAAQARLPFRWLSGCLSAGYPVRRPFRSRSYVPAATVQPFSRGLRGLARAPRLEPGAHMVVQAAERLHHRPRQQAEHDEDERALQIELLQVEERREAEIRDHE